MLCCICNRDAFFTHFILFFHIISYNIYDSFVIDFLCHGNDLSLIPQNIIETMTKNNNYKSKIKALLFKKYAMVDYIEKYQKFIMFKNKYFNICPFSKSIKFDLIICGSDQIWNPNITDGLKKEYFGYIKKYKNKAISYAASCGDLKELKYEDKEKILNYTNNLGLIGVREKSLYDFFEQNQKTSYLNIDPTFLISKNEYIDGLKLQKFDNSYLLIYDLCKDEKLYKLAKKLAKKKKLKIKTICGYIPYNKNLKGKIYNCSPTEFLEYIYNAQYIITNSFHGLAFSLIFEKQFNILLPSKRPSRLVDLLTELNLISRIIYDEKKICDDYIDYVIINKKLNKKISESINYISKGLK